MRLAPALSLASIVAALALAPRVAFSRENEHQLGADLGLSVLKIDDKSTLSTGGGVGVHYSYSIDDTWNFLVEGSSSIVALHQNVDPNSAHDRPAGVDHYGVGAAYVIDILRWVPYLSALAGVYRLSGGALDSQIFLPGVSVGVGLDYKLTREWSVGVALREHLFVSKLSTYPSFVNMFARAQYAWGW